MSRKESTNGVIDDVRGGRGIDILCDKDSRQIPIKIKNKEKQNW